MYSDSSVATAHEYELLNCICMMSSMNLLILTDDLSVYAVTSCQDYVNATLFWRQLSESTLAIEM